MNKEPVKTARGVVTDLAFLRQRSEPVPPKSVESVKEALRLALAAQENCAGLAAIQIGLPLRAAIYQTDKAAGFLINPVIVERSGRYTMLESCMSIPGRRFKITRAAMVVVETEGQRLRFTGFGAAVIQHEIDHFNGITVRERYELCKEADRATKGESRKSKEQRKARRKNRKK